MDADPFDALSLQPLANLQSSVFPASRPQSHLDRDRDIGRFYAGPDHAHDPVRVPKESCSGIVLAYLGSRATEVDVYYICTVLKHLHGLDHLFDDSSEYLRDEGGLSRIALHLEP